MLCGGQRGSSALDTVWRQAVRAWHSAGTNGCSFTVIQDLQKCCEVVSHAQLLGPGQHVVVPTAFAPVVPMRPQDTSRRGGLGASVLRAEAPFRRGLCDGRGAGA